MKLWQARVGLLIVSLIWGMGYIATDESIKHVSVFQMQVFRFGISALILIIVFFKTMKKIRLRAIIYGILLGIVFFAAMSLHSAALETTTVSKNSFLVVLNIVFVPIIMYLLFKVKVHSYYFYGVIMMFIGFFILLFINFSNIAGSFTDIAGQAHLVLGDYLTIIAALVFSIQIIMIGLFVQKENAIILVTIQLLTTSIISLIYCLVLGESVLIVTQPEFIAAFPAILFLGVAGCISFGGQIYIQKFLDPSDVSVIFSTESLFATIFSVMLGLEPLTMNLAVGAIIITIGIIWAETGFKFKKKH